jgi:hypothetical protein
MDSVAWTFRIEGEKESMIWDESWFMLMCGVAVGISIAISYRGWLFKLKWWSWHHIQIIVGLFIALHLFVVIGELGSLFLSIFIPSLFWMFPYFVVGSVPILIFDAWLYCGEWIKKTWTDFGRSRKEALDRKKKTLAGERRPVPEKLSARQKPNASISFPLHLRGVGSERADVRKTRRRWGAYKLSRKNQKKTCGGCLSLRKRECRVFSFSLPFSFLPFRICTLRRGAANPLSKVCKEVVQ